MRTRRTELIPGHSIPERAPRLPRPAPTPTDRGRKRPFEVDEVIRRIRREVADKPKAVLFELAERGYGSPFEILIACIITIRTLEEVSLPTSLRLLDVARTPREMARLTPARIDELIRTCT